MIGGQVSNWNDWRVLSSDTLQPTVNTTSFPVVYPSVSVEPKGNEQRTYTFIVDINQAGIAELSLLPGIGLRLANEIIRTRAINGGYQKPADLIQVKGIGPKTFSKMEPFVIVGEPKNYGRSEPNDIMAKDRQDHRISTED